VARALFFKTIAVRQNESYFDYKRVPQTPVCNKQHKFFALIPLRNCCLRPS